MFCESLTIEEFTSQSNLYCNFANIQLYPFQLFRCIFSWLLEPFRHRETIFFPSEVTSDVHKTVQDNVSADLVTFTEEILHGTFRFLCSVKSEIIAFQEEITEEDLLSYLADKNTTVETMTITHLLSMQALKPLGDFEVDYQFDPKSVCAVQK